MTGNPVDNLERRMLQHHPQTDGKVWDFAPLVDYILRLVTPLKGIKWLNKSKL